MNRQRNERDWGSVLRRSVMWAVVITFLVISISSSVVFVGGQLGPIGVLILGTFLFFAAFVVFLIIETLLELCSKSFAKETHIFFRLIGYAIALAPFVILIGGVFKENTREVRMRHAPPLTAEERSLLQSTFYDLRVGVAKGGAYRTLAIDLQDICLFERVDELHHLEKTDVIATPKLRYHGDKIGWYFSFHLPKEPENAVNVTAYYKIGPKLGDHDQYMDRLAVESITALKILYGQDELRASHSNVDASDAKLGCRRRLKIERAIQDDWRTPTYLSRNYRNVQLETVQSQGFAWIIVDKPKEGRMLVTSLKDIEFRAPFAQNEAAAQDYFALLKSDCTVGERRIAMPARYDSAEFFYTCKN